MRAGEVWRLAGFQKQCHGRGRERPAHTAHECHFLDPSIEGIVPPCLSRSRLLVPPPWYKKGRPPNCQKSKKTSARCVAGWVSNSFSNHVREANHTNPHPLVVLGRFDSDCIQYRLYQSPPPNHALPTSLSTIQPPCVPEHTFRASSEWMGVGSLAMEY
jgi:hypothetical protein